MDKYDKMINDIVNKRIKMPSNYQKVIQTAISNKN